MTQGIQSSDDPAERAVLCAVLLENETLPKARALLAGADDFHDPKHATVWEAMCALSDAGTPIDVITLASELKKRHRINAVGGPQFLSELSDAVPTAANVESHARIVAAYALARRQYQALIDAARELQAAPGDPASGVAKARKRLASVKPARPAKAEKLEAPPEELTLADRVTETLSDSKIGQPRVRQNLVANLVVEALKARGEFLLEATHGEALYRDGTTAQVHPVHGSDVSGLVRRIAGINSAESVAKVVAAEFEHVCHDPRTRRVHLRQLFWFDAARRALYLDLRDGTMLRVTARGRELLPNGADDVLFGASGGPPVRIEDPGDDDGLIGRTLLVANFPRNLSDELKTLLFAYVAALPFASALGSRPLGVFLGEKDSGKSLTAKLVMQFYVGPSADVMKVPNKEDGFVAVATRSTLFAIDNHDTFVQWLDDHLCCVATGSQIPLRTLFTTNTLAVHRYTTNLMVTSRVAARFRRDDVASRCLFFPVESLAEAGVARRGEEEFRNALAAASPRIWGQLLVIWQKALADLDADYTPVTRCVDWERVAAACARAFGIGTAFSEAIAAAAQRQLAATVTDNPIAEALVEWLAGKDSERDDNDTPVQVPRTGRPVTSGELFKVLKVVAEGQGNGRTWPVSSAAFGKKFKEALPGLRQLCGVRTGPIIHNTASYIFELPTAGKEGEHEPSSPVLPPLENAEDSRWS